MNLSLSTLQDVLDATPALAENFARPEYVVGPALSKIMIVLHRSTALQVSSNTSELVNMMIALGDIHGPRLASWAADHLGEDTATWLHIQTCVNNHFTPVEELASV